VGGGVLGRGVGRGVGIGVNMFDGKALNMPLGENDSCVLGAFVGLLDGTWEGDFDVHVNPSSR